MDFTVTGPDDAGNISARFTLAQPDGSWPFTSALIMQEAAWAAMPTADRDAAAQAQYNDYYATATNPAPAGPQTELFGPGDGSTLKFSYTPMLPPLVVGSVAVDYPVGGVTYTAIDDGEGNMIGRWCKGTVNYATGETDLTFAQAPAGDLIFYYQRA